jgi:hypothetical protein
MAHVARKLLLCASLTIIGAAMVLNVVTIWPDTRFGKNVAAYIHGQQNRIEMEREAKYFKQMSDEFKAKKANTH